LTVDLDVSKEDDGSWYFKIFVNGVMSNVSRVTSHDWTFAQPLYFGCRNNSGVKSMFSDVNIYDIKIYTSSLNMKDIVQNYISAVEQASLVNGVIDSTLDSSLREKNLFDSSGNCLIWSGDNFLDSS
jgi:hypothetical protein